LVTRFSQTALPALLGRGLPFLTLAADGTLHPMLCSYLEWLAVDARTLRLAIAAQSRSARNLEERGVGTLLLVEPTLTIYIKCRAIGAPLPAGGLARFSLTVEDVLEDAPTEEGRGRADHRWDHVCAGALARGAVGEGRAGCAAGRVACPLTARPSPRPLPLRGRGRSGGLD